MSLTAAGALTRNPHFDVDTHQRSAHSTGTGSEVLPANRFAYTTDEDLQSSILINRHPNRAGTRNIICWRLLTTRSELTSIIVTPHPPCIDMRHPDHCRSITMRLGLETAQKLTRQNGRSDSLEGWNGRNGDNKQIIIQNGEKAWNGSNGLEAMDKGQGRGMA